MTRLRAQLMRVLAGAAYACAAPAAALGLVPCEPSAKSDFLRRAAPPPEELVLEISVVEGRAPVPMFVQVLRDGDGMRLLGYVVDTDSLATLDDKHYFNPWPERLVERSVTLSDDAARLLVETVETEIDAADPKYAPPWLLGAHGLGYGFRVGEKCAWTVEPPPGTRAARLVDVVEWLGLQVAVPFRPFQYYVERLVMVRLAALSEETTLETPSPLFGIGVVIVALAALPWLLAVVVAALPAPLPRGRTFVVVSGALAYGSTCAVFVFLVLPVFVVLMELDLHGDRSPKLALALLEWAPGVLLVLWLYFSVRWPIYLRRRAWPRLVGPPTRTELA